MIEIIGNLMPVMDKYSNVNPKWINIDVLKYNEGTVIKIKSDKVEVGEALAEVLTLISGINSSCKIDINVEDLK